MAQKIEDLTESKNFFAELFQIISRFVLVKKIFGVRCTLKEGKLKRETEALIIAAQDQAIRTNYIKTMVDKSE